MDKIEFTEIKEINNYTEKQIIKLTRKYYVEENYQVTEYLYNFGLKKYPDSDKLLFEFGNYYFEKNDFENAINYIDASIKLKPKSNPKKYFLLGEMLQNPENIKYYEQGIKLSQEYITKIQNLLLNTENKKKLNKRISNYNRNIAQSLSALGEIFLNSNSNDKAYNYFIESIKYDKYYLEAYYQLIFLSINRKNYEEFKNYVDTLINIIKEIKKVNYEDLKEYNSVFFLPIIRVLQESMLYEESCYLCELVLNKEINNVEILYLYTFSNFYLKNYDDSLEILEKLKELNYGEDKEIHDGSKELYEEIMNINNDDKMNEEDNWVNE